MQSVQRNFEGMAVIVTGGASGIGAAAAWQFARQGAAVSIADVGDGDAVAAAMTAEGLDATSIRCDVTAPEQVQAMVNSTVERLGRLDACFNAAGILGEVCDLVGLDQSIWDRTIAINLTGTFNCLRCEIPALVASGGGAIVNTASIMGLVGIPEQAAYVASKHGVVGLTRVAALDHVKDGVRVNALCPGFTETPMSERWISGDRERAEMAASAQPIGRMGTAEEIAAAAVWMCSPGTEFMTGTTLTVDGCYTAA